MEAIKFKVGDKVTLLCDRSEPIAIDYILEISPIRGDIKLKTNNYNFDNTGWQKGDSWHRKHIRLWEEKDTEIIKIKNMRRIIKQVNLDTISDDDVKKIYEILKN